MSFCNELNEDGSKFDTEPQSPHAKGQECSIPNPFTQGSLYRHDIGPSPIGMCGRTPWSSNPYSKLKPRCPCDRD